MSKNDPNGPDTPLRAYPGGIESILDRMDERRDPFVYAEGDIFPDPDIDLVPLVTQIVTNPDKDPSESRPIRLSYHRKRYTLRHEFKGESELAFLNALLISHLRKSSWPDHTPSLFQRLWQDHGPDLIEQLNMRWLVSSVTTFGDHGTTPTQRSLGLSMSVLFGMMKLYESERLFSGVAPETPFTISNRTADNLPMGMEDYAISSGALDSKLIGRLWQECDADPVLGPVVRHLLSAIIDAESGLFVRLADLREQHTDTIAHFASRPEKPAPMRVPVPPSCVVTDPRHIRWATVSTIKAPLVDVARFCAHHLDIGVDHMFIFLDDPDAEIRSFFSPHPQITVVECDDNYWSKNKKQRPASHQLRQVFNACRVLNRDCDTVDWIMHLDVDEFLIPTRPMTEILADVAAEDAAAIIQPIEALACDDGPVRAFKRTHRQVGLKSHILHKIYPTFGEHLHGGFVGHTIGKSITRTGLDASGLRLGIHAPRQDGAEITNRGMLDDIVLAHLHVTSWSEFKSKLAFRRDKGSYRHGWRGKNRLGTGELLAFLMENEGEDGLRQFYEEVCADSDALRQNLADHDMLVLHDLDLDAQVQKIFGPLP